LVHQRYEWSYLYAFVRPKSGEVHWLIWPTVNARVFSLALEHLARQVGAGTRRRIPLVLDQAGWHTGGEVELPEGVHLEFLPSASPELQPSERLWPLSNEGVNPVPGRWLNILRRASGTMEGRGRPSGPRPCRQGDAPGGRRYLPLPFVQLWRHAPSNNVGALLVRTQRLLVCH